MSLHDRTKLTMYLPQGGDPEQVNLASLFHPGMLGGRFVHPNTSVGNKEYQLVRVDSTATVTPYAGATAWWSNKATYLVTTSATNRGQVAGIFTFAANLGNYTCIQLEGRHNAVKIVQPPTAAPTAAGLFVIPSATDSKADVLASGSAATFPVLGRTAGTLQPDSTCAVDLNVPEIP